MFELWASVRHNNARSPADGLPRLQRFQNNTAPRLFTFEKFTTKRPNSLELFGKHTTNSDLVLSVLRSRTVGYCVFEIVSSEAVLVKM